MLKYNPHSPLYSLHIPKTAGTSFENVLGSWFNKSNFSNLNNHPRLFRVLTPLNIDFFIHRLLSCGLYHHYSNEQLNKKPRRIPLEKKYGLFQRAKIRECVHGHFDPQTDGGDLFSYYPDAFQFIAFLRDPLEMQLSLFFYMRKMISDGQMYWRGKKITKMEYDGDIDKWLTERNGYMMAFFPMKFSKYNFIETINSYFVHIGVVECMQQSIDILADKLGFKSSIATVQNSSTRDILPSAFAIKKFKEKHELEYLIYNYAVSLNKCS